MDRVKVRIYVPLGAALAANKSAFGETEICLGDDAIASLSDGARALLRPDGLVAIVEAPHGGESLRVAEATTAATLAALEVRAAEAASWRAAKEAEAEARVLEAIAAPDDAWISGGGHSAPPFVFQSPGIVGFLTYAQQSDPRIEARRAEAQERALPTAVAAWEAKREADAEAKRDALAMRQEGVTRRESMERSARAWVVDSVFGPPELVRAAREGRNISSALREQVGLAVLAAVEAAIPPGCFVAETYSEEERTGVPSTRAYALLDAITAALPRIAEAARLPGATATVSNIMRFDVAPSGPAVYRTGVSITVSHPWLETAKSEFDVLTEPPPSEEDEDSDD